MSEATSEHSARPVTGHSGFARYKRVIAKRAPADLWNARRARRGLRALRGRR